MKKTLTTVIGIAAVAALALTGCTKEDAPVDNGTDESVAETSFPEKDIRLIIQANPGGGSDLSSRALATELEDILGVNVIAENMPGAAGAIAMEYVGDQPADGYTIGFGPVEIAMLNTTQNANVLPENYTFLGQIMDAPGVISVGANSPYETLEDLVEAAQSGEITVSNSGVGSIWEAAGIGLGAATGGDFTPVAYDGGATAVAAAASGEADASISGVGEAIAQGDAVRMLAVFYPDRHPNIPDVPTAEEEIGEALYYSGWGGIYAPAGLPDDVKKVLADAIAEATATDSYKEFQAGAGNLVVTRTADEHGAFVQEQFEMFKELLG